MATEAKGEDGEEAAAEVDALEQAGGQGSAAVADEADGQVLEPVGRAGNMRCRPNCSSSPAKARRPTGFSVQKAGSRRAMPRRALR